VDGHSHHVPKKQDLQVSKGKGWVMQKGQDEVKAGARGWVDRKLSLLPVYICAYLSHIGYLRITLLCV
jgi:hypothetical protein